MALASKESTNVRHARGSKAYSRRHDTSKPHEKASNTWLDHDDAVPINARIRAAAWAKLSPAEKLAELDRRLGKGVGAARQRAKLAAAIEAVEAVAA